MLFNYKEIEFYFYCDTKEDIQKLLTEIGKRISFSQRFCTLTLNRKYFLVIKSLEEISFELLNELEYHFANFEKKVSNGILYKGYSCKPSESDKRETPWSPPSYWTVSYEVQNS